MSCCGARKIYTPQAKANPSLTAVDASVSAQSQGARPLAVSRIEARMSLCKSCPYNVENKMCSLCGCQLVHKIGKEAEHCPANKW